MIDVHIDDSILYQQYLQGNITIKQWYDAIVQDTHYQLLKEGKIPLDKYREFHRIPPSEPDPEFDRVIHSLFPRIEAFPPANEVFSR